MAEVARGSDVAFGVLFERYKARIFAFFLRRLPDRAQAEELTQDTFLAILQAGERYRASALFRTWLYAVALNILRSHRRRTLLRGLFTGRTAESNDPPAPGSLEAGLILREAIERLKPLDREILMLREFEELNYAEIAAVLNIPINTVRSRLFRGRTALRELLRAPEAPGRQLTRVEERS